MHNSGAILEADTLSGCNTRCQCGCVPTSTPSTRQTDTRPAETWHHYSQAVTLVSLDIYVCTCTYVFPTQPVAWRYEAVRNALEVVTCGQSECQAVEGRAAAFRHPVVKDPLPPSPLIQRGRVCSVFLVRDICRNLQTEKYDVLDTLVIPGVTGTLHGGVAGE